MKLSKTIRFLLALLLIGASMSSCLPWRVLQKSMITFAADTEEDDQNESSDEKDTDDKNDERDEKESEPIDKDYLGIHTSLHFVVVEKCDWNAIDDQSVNHPIFDILVPPPKGNC